MKLIQGPFRYADAHDMYDLLGVKRLPPEGMPERVIQGVRVYVKPLPDRPVRKRQSLRVTAICECGQHLAVGRMIQHKCKEQFVSEVDCSCAVGGPCLLHPVS